MKRSSSLKFMALIHTQAMTEWLQAYTAVTNMQAVERKPHACLIGYGLVVGDAYLAAKRAGVAMKEWDASGYTHDEACNWLGEAALKAAAEAVHQTVGRAVAALENNEDASTIVKFTYEAKELALQMSGVARYTTEVAERHNAYLNII